MKPCHILDHSTGKTLCGAPPSREPHTFKVCVIYDHSICQRCAVSERKTTPDAPRKIKVEAFG